VPFVTTAIWQGFNQEKDLMVESWPTADEKSIDEKSEKKFELIKEIVVKIRNLRSEYKVEPAKKITAQIKVKNQKEIEAQIEVIKYLARLEKLDFVINKPEKAACAVVENIEIYLPLAELIDSEKEKERLSKEFESLQKYLIGLDKKLSNKEFVDNAPRQVVDIEKQKQADAREKLEKIKNQLQETS
jgi:valyl-tRNA synthetase